MDDEETVECVLYNRMCSLRYLLDLIALLFVDDEEGHLHATEVVQRKHVPHHVAHL